MRARSHQNAYFLFPLITGTAINRNRLRVSVSATALGKETVHHCTAPAVRQPSRCNILSRRYADNQRRRPTCSHTSFKTRALPRRYYFILFSNLNSNLLNDRNQNQNDLTLFSIRLPFQRPQDVVPN